MKRLAAPLVLLVLASCGGQGGLRLEGDRARQVVVGGATLRVAIQPDERRRVSEGALVSWVERSATMVSGICGRFPVPDLEVTVGAGGRLGWGQHRRGREVYAVAGAGVDARDLERDWVLVHEMLHTAFPDLDRRHLWMREGLSTYLQTMVRARAGVFAPEEMWSRYADRMPLGRPRARDRGLDRTRSWGSTYWGGALFWMAVDVELRRQTNGARSIDDIMCAMMAEGGNARSRWPMARVLRVADEATGTSVMSDTYRDMALERGDVDLEVLFARLGVESRRGAIVLHDDAVWSGIRRQMESRDDRTAAAMPVVPRTHAFARRVPRVSPAERRRFRRARHR
ncbi:MAG: hypothetical protein AB8I08_24850 [Sandaracinaceae bacterium]